MTSPRQPGPVRTGRDQDRIRSWLWRAAALAWLGGVALGVAWIALDRSVEPALAVGAALAVVVLTGFVAVVEVVLTVQDRILGRPEGPEPSPRQP